MATANNTTEWTADSTSISHSFYLQNDQYIIIKGLPEGAVYTVDDINEDYLKIPTNPATGTAGQDDYVAATSFTLGSDTNEVTFVDAPSGRIGTKDIKTGFTNKKDGVVPTGILLTYTPYIIISVIAVAGIIFLAVRRRRNAE